VDHQFEIVCRALDELKAPQLQERVLRRKAGRADLLARPAGATGGVGRSHGANGLATGRG
jgi:hypothetical protein